MNDVINNLVVTSFKIHEICRISTFFCLSSYCHFKHSVLMYRLLLGVGLRLGNISHKWALHYPGGEVRVITRKLARSRHSTPLFHEVTRRARLREEA